MEMTVLPKVTYRLSAAHIGVPVAPLLQEFFLPIVCVSLLAYLVFKFIFKPSPSSFYLILNSSRTYHYLIQFIHLLV